MGIRARMMDKEASEDVVNWDGVLEPKERRRILDRIHSAFGAIGARIPETVESNGRRLRLRDTIHAYLDKDLLSPQEIEAVESLSAALEAKAREDEMSIREGELTESGAVGLMREVLGILRALDHLRKLREDPEKAGLARSSLMKRVDDERRWLAFLKNVR
jgi:Family of unknown function (DUF5788)